MFFQVGEKKNGFKHSPSNMTQAFQSKKLKIFFRDNATLTIVELLKQSCVMEISTKKKNKNQYVFVEYYCTASGIKVSSIFYSFCNITF